MREYQFTTPASSGICDRFLQLQSMTYMQQKHAPGDTLQRHRCRNEGPDSLPAKIYWAKAKSHYETDRWGNLLYPWDNRRWNPTDVAFLNRHFGGFQNFQGNRFRSKFEEEQVTLQRELHWDSFLCLFTKCIIFSMYLKLQTLILTNSWNCLSQTEWRETKLLADTNTLPCTRPKTNFGLNGLKPWRIFLDFPLNFRMIFRFQALVSLASNQQLLNLQAFQHINAALWASTHETMHPISLIKHIVVYVYTVYIYMYIHISTYHCTNSKIKSITSFQRYVI